MMSRIVISLAAVAALSAASAAPAVAHVTLEQPQAAAGAPYKAVFRVPHGCDGSATVRLRVQIPEGVIAVKPMVKPGWAIEVTRAPYAKPYSFLHGAKFTEGPKEITWTGNLPDAFYDEFVISTFIAGELPAGRMLYFPVVQECEKGVHRWVGTAAAGHAAADADEPAPGVMLIDKAKPAHE